MDKLRMQSRDVIGSNIHKIQASFRSYYIPLLYPPEDSSQTDMYRMSPQPCCLYGTASQSVSRIHHTEIQAICHPTVRSLSANRSMYRYALLRLLSYLFIPFWDSGAAEMLRRYIYYFPQHCDFDTIYFNMTKIFPLMIQTVVHQKQYILHNN